VQILINETVDHYQHGLPLTYGDFVTSTSKAAFDYVVHLLQRHAPSNQFGQNNVVGFVCDKCHSKTEFASFGPAVVTANIKTALRHNAKSNLRDELLTENTATLPPLSPLPALSPLAPLFSPPLPPS
jgi:hypothetical protein